MKAYYLRLTQDNFAKAGTEWTSQPIDLYVNDSYFNYSTLKSQYGLNLLGDKTWLGLNVKTQDSDPSLFPDEPTYPLSGNLTYTDSGVVVDNRFIDLSGRIDIMAFVTTITNVPGNGSVYPILDVHTSDDQDSIFPDEWAVKANNTEIVGIGLVNSYRYARFVLRFNTNVSMDEANVELLVRVDIDVPLMTPMYKRTRAALSKFPEWMYIRELDHQDSATPVSMGGQLLNAVAGEWLDDLDATLTSLDLEPFIQTANENQKAWAFISGLEDTKVWSIAGDGVAIARVASQNEFIEASDTDYVCFIDPTTNSLYTNKEYNALLVNGIELEQHPQQIWNRFDDFGLLVDLGRHNLETNVSFKGRILDVHRNAPGVAIDNFKLALRRELNLWKSFGATPDWRYEGATPEILEINDLEENLSSASPSYVGPDDVPTQRFRDLVELLATQYPTTWGYFRWDKAYWDIGGLESKGYGALAYRYDPENVPDIQTGVGDGDDLYVYRPDEIKNPNDFTARLQVRGLARTYRYEYREVKFNIEFYGQADRKVYNNPEVAHWLTVEFITTAATPLHYFTTFEMSAISNIDASNSINSNHVKHDLWEDTGWLRSDVVLYDSSGAQVDPTGATPSDLNWADVGETILYYGRWDPATQDFTDKPVVHTSNAWWSDNPTTVLPSDIWLTADLATPSTYSLEGSIPVGPYVVFESIETSYTIGKWQTEHILYEVKLNGAFPDQAQLPMTIELPEIVWDQYLENTPNKEYIVQILTIDTEGNYGGFTIDADGSNLLVAADGISLNNNHSWTTGRQSISSSTTELTFKTDTGISNYPVYAPVWNLFESEAVNTITGTVDENGPWRNGVPPSEGNTNFNLTQVDVNRDYFNVPNDDNHVITWINVTVLNNENVIAWLDTNTVKPVHPVGTQTYPSNTIIEEYNAGTSKYTFTPFILRARLRPGINPRWYPEVHSGWFYAEDEEYYLYTNPVEEYVNAATPTLSGIARQGAPIIVKTDEATPIEFRQIAFTVDDATPTLTLVNVELIPGTNIVDNIIYLGYEDVYDIEVTELTTGQAITINGPNETSTNQIAITNPVNAKKTMYKVSYKLAYSFYANNQSFSNGNQVTQLVFDKEIAGYGVSDLLVVYESALHDVATPIPIPLNTFYTVQDEGFIFIGFDEYDLHTIEVRISPSNIVADGQDFIMISVRSIDTNNNPKGFQHISVATNWGTLDNTNLITDEDGFATAILTAANSTTSLTGTITVNGTIEIHFSIRPVPEQDYRLAAIPSADRIPADGRSTIMVYGTVENADYQFVPYAKIAYRKARSVYELFTKSYDGQVIADDRGRFILGPFTAATPWDPGYWFVAAESWSASSTPYTDSATPPFDLATPNYSDHNTPEYGPVGDVVLWHEYPDVQYAVENITGLPTAAMQLRQAADSNPPYSNIRAFPVYYDQATPHAPATPVTIGWEPPKWYAIPMYIQYQLGLLGTGIYSLDFSNLNNLHPDYKDL